MAVYDEDMNEIEIGGRKEAPTPESSDRTAHEGHDPEIRALLDTIASHESTGYDSMYSGSGRPRRFSDFSDHPRSGDVITKGPNAGQTSSAAGRYGLIKTTWDKRKAKHGLPDFSPESQDVAAAGLAEDTYGPDLLDTLRTDDDNAIADVGRRLNGQWTSLPGGIESSMTDSDFVDTYRRNLAKYKSASAADTGRGKYYFTEDDLIPKGQEAPEQSQAPVPEATPSVFDRALNVVDSIKNNFEPADKFKLPVPENQTAEYRAAQDPNSPEYAAYGQPRIVGMDRAAYPGSVPEKDRVEPDHDLIQMNRELGVPVKPEYIDKVRETYEAAAPDLRKKMTEAQGPLGAVSRYVDKKYQGGSLANTDLGGRVEDIAARNSMNGMEPKSAQVMAQREADFNADPIKGQAYNTELFSEHPFDSERAKELRKANPIVRGATQGADLLKQQATGLHKMIADVGESIGVPGAAGYGRAQMEARKRLGTRQAEMGEASDDFNRNLEGAIASTISNAPGYAVGLFTGGQTVPLMMMSTQVAGDEYATGIEHGLTKPQALVRSVGMGAAEYLGEKLGFKDQVDMLKRVAGGNWREFEKHFVKTMAEQIAGEEGTTLAQFGIDKSRVGINPEATAQDLFDQVKDTLHQTVLQTALMGAPGSAAAVHRKLKEGDSRYSQSVSNPALSTAESRAIYDQTLGTPIQTLLQDPEYKEIFRNQTNIDDKAMDRGREARRILADKRATAALSGIPSSSSSEHISSPGITGETDAQSTDVSNPRNEGRAGDAGQKEAGRQRGAGRVQQESTNPGGTENLAAQTGKATVEIGNAQQKSETGSSNGGSGSQSGVRQEGGSSGEGSQRLQPSGQENRNLEEVPVGPFSMHRGPGGITIVDGRGNPVSVHKSMADAVEAHDQLTAQSSQQENEDELQTTTSSVGESAGSQNLSGRGQQATEGTGEGSGQEAQQEGHHGLSDIERRANALDLLAQEQDNLGNQTEAEDLRKKATDLRNGEFVPEAYIERDESSKASTLTAQQESELRGHNLVLKKLGKPEMTAEQFLAEESAKIRPAASNRPSSEQDIVNAYNTAVDSHNATLDAGGTSASGSIRRARIKVATSLPSSGLLQRRTAESIAKIFGHKVIFVESEDGRTLDIDGSIIGSHPNHILLAVDSKQHLSRVAVHEMVHGLRRNAPEIYAQLVRNLREHYNVLEVSKHLASRGYEQALPGKGDNPDEFTPENRNEEEWVSDHVSDIIHDPKAVRQLAERMEGQKKGSGQQFLRHVKDFIDALISKLKGAGFGTEAAVAAKHLRKSRDAVVEALASYHQHQEAKSRGEPKIESDVAASNRREAYPAKKSEAKKNADIPASKRFVNVPGVGIDLGEITPEVAKEIGRQSGKIRLEAGEHLSRHKGFGLAHIKAEHDDIKNPEEFVADVAANYDEIYRTFMGRLLLVKNTGNRTRPMAVVQLQPHAGGDYYSVVTAYYPRKIDAKALLWSATQSRSDVTDIRPVLKANRPAKVEGAPPGARQKEVDESVLQKDQTDNDIPSSRRKVFSDVGSSINQAETEAFKRWSHNAPYITSAQAEVHKFKTGEPVVVDAYHGTGRPDRVGTRFMKKRATSGPMAFFTSNPELASGYAKGKSDTSLAYEDGSYASWFKYKPKGARSPVDIVRAWYLLPSEVKSQIRRIAPELRLDDEAERVVREPGNTSGNGSYDHNLKESARRGFGQQGNPLEALVEDWLSSGTLFDEEEKFMDVLNKAGFPIRDVHYDSPNASYPFVYKTYLQMQNPLVTSDIPQSVTEALDAAAKRDRTRAALGGADAWDKNTRTLREWVSDFHKEDNAYVWTSIPDKVTKVFETLGYDGIIDWSGKSGASVVSPVFIPFSETQVKSALGNNGKFDSSKTDIRFSNRRNPTFFSQLGKAIETAKQDSMPGSQWRLWLQSNKAKLGVKDEEIAWTGLDDYLQLNGKDRLTKDDISAFLKDNGIQVKEAMLSKDATRWNGNTLYVEGKKVGSIQEDDKGYVFVGVNGDTKSLADSVSMFGAVGEVERMFDVEGASNKDTAPKYEQYTLQGGSNYRELLLTLPPEETSRRTKLNVINDRVNALTKGRRIDDLSESERREYDQLVKRHDAIADLPYGTDYHSSHWDEPNILAHIRFNDRTDADGNKVLFIEELQSDWGQQYRKYKDQNTDDLATALRQVDKNPIPDAPFIKDTKSWLSLALKRIIRYAAEGDYDKVAFVNGEQSADRYDLSKQVGLLSVSKTGEDKYLTYLEGKDGEALFRNQNGFSHHGQKTVSASELEDMVGKELAKKAIEGKPNKDGWVDIRGTDLKVGGEGMKSFYDKIVPQVTNDVLKKLGGGKVESVEFGVKGSANNWGGEFIPGNAHVVARSTNPGIYQVWSKNPRGVEQMWGGNFSTYQEAMNYIEELESSMSQSGFDVTQALRDKALEGMPLFSNRRNVEGNKVDSTWNSPVATALDNVIYSLQDKLIDTKRVQQAIERAGRAIEDEWNPYQKEMMYHGRSAKLTQDFLVNEIKPLFKAMADEDVSMGDLETFLWNRHAKERNAQIASINPGMPDAGSGISDQDADDYFNGLSQDQRDKYERLAKMVDRITKGTRKLLVESGLETQDTVLDWQHTYEHYVPLQRADVEGSRPRPGTGQGFSIKGPSTKRAMGSDKPVVDILANLMMQRERTIVRSEKNKVALALYGLAIQNENPGFWLPVNPEAMKAPVKTMTELMNLGMNSLDFDGLMKEPTVRTINPKTGLVESVINPVLRNRDNVLAVRVNGKDRFIFFNQEDPRAIRMVESLKNLDADQLGTILTGFRAVTRWFASVNTQFNPIFGIVNLTRDVGGGAINLTSTRIAGKEATVLKHLAPAIAGIYKDLRADRKGNARSGGDWSKLWEEFQEVGGKTGYRDLYMNSEDRAKALQKEIDAIYDGASKKFFKGIFNWLSDYNETLENGVRLSAYKVARDQGISKDQAASLAKNLTVNFNKKGQIAQQAGALYAFFNASVQGTARLAETLAGPAGKKIVVGGLLLGSAQAILLSAAGFDDDEPPQFVRERNIIIPLGKKNFVTIPMPLGLHVIPNTGRVLTEIALNGGEGAAKQLVGLLGSYIDAFDPMGSSGLSVQTLTPTLIDPIAALSENRDSFGKEIAKKDRSSLAPTPGFTRAKETASVFGHWISKAANYLSGGTKFVPGEISPTPDQVDFLIGQVTGGVGREALKVDQTVRSLISGEELPPHKIPLVGRFYGTNESQSAESGKFYSNLTMLNKHEAQMKGMAEEGADVDAYVQKNPEAVLAETANSVERELTKLKTQKRLMLSRGAEKSDIKGIEGEITSLMRDFNQQVKASREAPDARRP